ncbi:MAG: hypothetical protein HY074_14325 [Deltaproteobacteria bacterium]|nr:hypothetical protein [Deltaproteobacteria bacterium]
MSSETRKLVIERYTYWSETWGMSLAFAVTQSVEKSERIMADAIVALMAAVTEQQGVAMIEARLAQYHRNNGAELTNDLPTKAKPAPLLHGITATRFAAVIWEMANAQAYRGFGIDPFFRMPAIARAVVIMKIKAQFSRQQIAGVLRITANQVDDHLENARLLFSDGRPWVEASPELNIQGTSWTPECPQWNSIPMIETAPEMRKHLTKVTKMALKIKRPEVGGAPKALPGIRKILRRSLLDGQIRAMAYGAIAVMFFQFYFHKHSLLPRFIHRLIH